MRVIGESPKAAQYAGMRIGGTILWVMFLSGGLAGLAGMAEASGIHYRLQQGLAVGYGYTGIIVAALSRLHPGGVILAALFIAGLLVGGDQLQTVMHLPSAVGFVLEGTLLFFVLGSDFVSRYRVRWRAPHAMNAPTLIFICRSRSSRARPCSSPPSARCSRNGAAS